MTAIASYEPINTLKPIAAGVWLVDGPLIEFNYAGLRLPFPTRMTIIRLAAGDLWLHSPTALTPGLKAEVDALGPVRHLIAPNKLHYWWIGDWQSAYPEALAHAAPGVRRRAARRGIAFERDLGARPAAAWAGEIDQVLVPGSFMTEVAFFHRPSRSLILTDLIERFEAPKVRRGWLRLLMRLGGVLEPGGTPRDLRLTYLGHGKAVRHAVTTMLAWRPRHLIVAHGRCCHDDATGELARALRWMGL